MAIQFYDIKSTGKKYALDKATGKATEVSSIPSGGAVINWSGSSLPSELQNTGLPQPSTGQPSSQSTYTPPPVISPAQYQSLKQMVSSGQTTPKEAVQYLNDAIKRGEYSGSVDTNQFIGFNYTGADGATYQVSSDLNPIRTSAAVSKTNITPQGIYTTPSGVQVDASGKVVSQPLPDVPHPNDDIVKKLIENPNLTADQKSIFEEYFKVLSRNDVAKYNQLVAAFNASTQFSDPYFKAQTAMVTDALTRELSANAGDLEFAEKQLSNTLKDLRESTAASAGYLDFQKEQELKSLDKEYEVELENKRQNLAAVGKTSSSVRSKAEQLLSEQKEGLVESVGKQFSYQTGQLSSKLAGGERNTALELERLKDVNTQKRIAELRRTESLIGSGQLSSLGYGGGDVLGDVGGDIERQKIQNALSFSNNFVF